MICLGVGTLGFFPWHERIGPHLVCANAIFYGGTGWSVANAFLLRSTGRITPQRAKLIKIQLALLAVSIASLLLMLRSLSGAFDDEREFSEMLKQAHDHFA